MNNAEKIDAIRFCLERFDQQHCSNVQMGFMSRHEECDECAEALLTVVRDVLDGKGLPTKDWDAPDAENADAP